MQPAIKLGGGGRIVIPMEYREALGLRPGDEAIGAMPDQAGVSAVNIGEVAAKLA